MKLKINEGKFKFNGELIMSPERNKINKNTFELYQYQINELTDMRNTFLENNSSIKSFNNEIVNINLTHKDLIEEINRGKQNIEILVQ